MEENLVPVPVTDVIAEKTDPPVSEDCNSVVTSNTTIKNSADKVIVVVEQTKDAPNESHTVQEKKIESDNIESEPNRQDTFTCTVTVEVDEDFKLENSAEIVPENDTQITDSILTDIENSVNNVENPENEQGHESAEKEHNKSLSRELKSLMKAAKESKIINECTQVTTKMRKSRVRDLSNTNLNTNEANSIKGSRRSSENSQKSNSSEKSDNISQKRSMRSQNPDFVNKQKQFLHSVTGKTQKEKENLDKPNNFSESESGDERSPNKNNSIQNAPKRQRKVSEKQLSESLSKLKSDLFCWRCHWSVTNTGNEKPSLQPPARCTICPRSYHYKCLSSTERTKYSSEKTWVCPECLSILRAESSETRSPAMRKISLGTLHDLLKYALKRMTVINGVEHFMQPVDCAAFPDYDKYVVRPMDLTLMEQNIEKGLYGSTEAFTSDALWILHNSIIFNTGIFAVQSKLTATARSIVRTCRTEMGEIETCPECYAAAHARRPTWFTDVCSTPHILIWAKLKGFPYWPAKGMTMNASGMVDVRFFGQHDRAWVPARDCYLYCDRDPNNFRTKKQELIDSMQEAEHHITNLSRKFNGFIHAAFKTPLDLSKWDEQLKMMIPGFQGDITMPMKVTKEKNLSNTSSPMTKENRQRSNSKSSKEFLMDGDGSEDDEITKIPEGSRKMADGAEVACEEENKDNNSNQPAEVDVITLQSMHVGSKKRRLSHLEEAVLTVIVPSEKRKRPDTPKTNLSEHKEPINVADMQNNAQIMDVDVQNPNTSEANNELSNSHNDNKGNETQKETHTMPDINKGIDTIQNSDKETEKDKDTSTESIKTNFEDGDSNKTINVSKLSEIVDSVDKDRMKNVSEKLKFSNQKSKLFVSRKGRNQRDDRNKLRVHHKINKRRSSLPKEKSTFKKSETSAESSTGQADNSVSTLAFNLVDSPDKKDNQKDKSESMVTSTPKNGGKSPTRSVKDCIVFDDDTSLAEIARNTNKTNVIVSVPGLPTISSVLSLSKSANIVDMKQRQIMAATRTPLNSDIFTTNNNKGAAAKTGQTKKETEKALMARVGVRAFARVPENPQHVPSTTTPSATTPSTTNREQVEVEIKTEPIDEDADRQTEKLDLLNTFRLRPVTQTTAVREPRPSKSTVVSSIRKVTTTKPADVRPRAKKTFPQPRKAEDGRSELNSKNSMVYIPIQPPANQAPVRGSPASRASCSSAASKNSTTTAVTSSANIMVNTVTTPLMQVACVQPGGGSQTGAGAAAGPGSGGTSTVAPIVGQVPTTVHTVPLIHSVNGQWTFSLQPVMSVGGSQLTNGVPERSSPSTAQAALVSALGSNQPALPPPPAQAARTNSESGSQVELPRLQQRPLLNPLDPTTPIGEVPTPSTAGCITAKLNQNAVKMADFFRNLLEDSLEKLNEPLTQVTTLKLQLERERWRHQQEIAELKHNHELSTVEMRTAMEKEKARLVSETRRVCQAELDAAVNHAKSRQWCANCRQEAQFYCCWNTSYCDYPCQRAHWAQHFSTCTQQRHQSGESSLVSAPEKRLQTSDSTASSNTNAASTPTPTLTVGGKVVPSRVYGTVHPTQNKQSIIVSMIDDGTGNQTVKCVGTYKPNPSTQPSPLLLNKQIMNTEESTKKVTPSGYIIVSGGGANSLLLN